jgi:hypothetical protein
MAVPRRVRRFINARVPVTLDCKYAKSNANNKGIARSLRRVSPKLLLRLHALLTLMPRGPWKVRIGVSFLRALSALPAERPGLVITN